MNQHIEKLQLEVEVLERLLNEKKNELTDLIKKSKGTIEDKIKECELKGIKVKRNRSWLWFVESDGRYDSKETVTDKHGNMELINKNKETEILKELGFQYSSNKMNYYYIHE